MNEIMNELIEEIQKDSRYLSFKDKSKLLLKKETNELLERYQETLNEINDLKKYEGYIDLTSKKEELKEYDVNMFLLEVERIEAQLKEVEGKYHIADEESKEASQSYENIKSEYEKLEQDMASMDDKIAFPYSKTIKEGMKTKEGSLDTFMGYDSTSYSGIG